MRRLLASTLVKQNYEVMLASTGGEALKSAVELEPDLVILDLSLPDISGLDVCRELRAWRPVPILVVSGRDEEAIKIKTLDMGADDFLTKPFGIGELMARVRALLRRSTAGPAAPAVVAAGKLHIDIPRRRVVRNGHEIRLTRTEFEILACLAQNANCVVSAKNLVQKIWGLRFVDDTQTLRVHIGHLRKKIEPDPSAPQYIVTEQGVGYRFSGTNAE